MTTDDRNPPVLPAGLRERVLAASLRARDVGRPVPAAPEISAAEAFGRAAGALYALLSFLSDEDWRTPVLRGLDVQGLVGHLIGVEHDMHRCLVGDPDVADAGHVESTQAEAIRQAARPPAQTLAEWRRAADRTLDLVRAAESGAESGPESGPESGAESRADVRMHGIRLPLDALLVVRAFELWTHDNDIRRAIGWGPSTPDASTLSMMTDLAARLLPHAAARTGLRGPLNVHLVLTGPGGGTWDVTVGQGPPGPAAVAIVTDAVEFCRLAANRVSPAELDVYVTGDAGRAAEVLAAATTLALD